MLDNPNNAIVDDANDAELGFRSVGVVCCHFEPIIRAICASSIFS